MVTTMVASNYSKVIDFEGNHSIRFEYGIQQVRKNTDLSIRYFIKMRLLLLWCMIYQIEEHLKKLKIIG